MSSEAIPMPRSNDLVMVRATNNRLVLWLSILAGLQSLTGGSILVDLFPEKVAGGIIALIGALQAGTAVYIAHKQPVKNGGVNDG